MPEEEEERGSEEDVIRGRAEISHLKSLALHSSAGPKPFVGIFVRGNCVSKSFHTFHEMDGASSTRDI
jgi:hypothetical protein